MLRKETLMPYGPDWEQPTAEEIREIIKVLGMSGSQISVFLGLQDSRSVRRWCSDNKKIPYSAWALLVHRAGYGAIWEEPYQFTPERWLKMTNSEKQ